MIAGPARSGRDRWLVSYADLMTILFAFFMTLYGASQMKVEQQIQAMSTPPPSTPAPDDAASPARDARAELSGALESDLADAIEAGRVEIVNSMRGVIVSLPESATFASGSADVSSGALEIIRQVAVVVGPRHNELRIEGHTDDQPIRTARFKSNWELSTARASAVVAFLVESAGIDPARLAAAGYGEHHPRVANDSPESRARNRRVDIVVLEPGAESEAAAVAHRQPPAPAAGG